MKKYWSELKSMLTLRKLWHHHTNHQEMGLDKEPKGGMKTGLPKEMIPTKLKEAGFHQRALHGILKDTPLSTLLELRS